MKFADTDSLLTLVDSADTNGHINFQLRKGETLRSQQHARDWLGIDLDALTLPMLRLDLVKKAVTEIDLSWQPSEAGVILRLNLAKLLLLPASAPQAELTEF